MRIDRRGDLPAIQVPEAAFKGDVAVTSYVRRAAPSRLVGATVTFAPGSRTPWKVNPCGQTLVVTDGVGWAQCEGGEIAEIRPATSSGSRRASGTGKGRRLMRP